MTKATCCRFSLAPWKIGRRSSTKSSSAKAAAALAREISKRSSRRSSASRNAAETCRDQRGGTMYPLKRGKFAGQAHVGIPEGTFEEEHGRKGFYGRSAHLYH